MTTERDRCGEPGATLHAVSSAVLAVTRHLSVHEVLQVIVRAAARLLDARYAALGVPDDAGSFAEFVVEGVTDEEWERIGPLPRQHGMLAVMLREKAPQRLADIRREPGFEGWPAAHPVLRDFLGVPIRDGDDVLGIIFLANKRRPGGFSEADQELLVLFAAHAAIAITNARLYERNRELTVMAERNRLARELHDAVAQKLFSLRLTAQAALALSHRPPDGPTAPTTQGATQTSGQRAAPSAAQGPAQGVASSAAQGTVQGVAGNGGRGVDQVVGLIEQIERLAAGAVAELRAVIFELRPADLAGDGLVASLRKQAEVLDRAHPAAVRFTAGAAAVALAGTLPDDQEMVIFRIAQEALHNALRHAGARSVEIMLHADAGRLVLEVADDGAGMGAGPGRDGHPGHDGLGLASMRERAESVGGALTIAPRPATPGGGAGTVVRLAVIP